MSTSHLRPLSFGEILDGAFVIYRRHFATFFTTALLPLLPVAVVWGVFGMVSGAGLDEEAGAATAVALLVAYPVMAVGMAFMWAALIHQTSRAVEGGPVDRGEAYRVALRRFLPLFGASIVTFFLATLGMLLLIIPGILVMIALFAVWHVVVIEGKGPLAALSRSRDLARGAWGRIFGIWLVTWLIVMIPSFLTGTVAGAAMFGAVMVSGDPDAAAGAVGWITAVNNVLSVLMSALTTPFMMSALTLLYYDRRVRSEALDLEIATERLAPTVS